MRMHWFTLFWSYPDRASGSGSRNSKENFLASEPFGRNGGISGIVNLPEVDQRELIDRAQAGQATVFERLAEQRAARWPFAGIVTGPRTWCKGHWSKRGNP